MESRDFYRRHLPHVQPLKGTYFVTYNLHGSIPGPVLAQWRDEYEAAKRLIFKKGTEIPNQLEILGKRDFIKRDAFFDAYKGGPHYFKTENLAEVVAESLHFWDNKKIELYAYCIMSNHVHFVFRSLEEEDEGEAPVHLEILMHSIKRYSAHKCNKILGIEGQFWRHESYDRFVRNQRELIRILKYVINNPVKAGLCAEQSDWKWTYIKDELIDLLAI